MAKVFILAYWRQPSAKRRRRRAGKPCGVIVLDHWRARRFPTRDRFMATCRAENGRLVDVLDRNDVLPSDSQPTE